jgi:hypothetical protein
LQVTRVVHTVVRATFHAAAAAGVRMCAPVNMHHYIPLERELGRTPLSSLDRGLATELTYGAIRQRRRLDAWLDQLGKVPAERQPPKLRWLLHLGLYQLLLSERVPDSAAVSTTVV